MNLYSSSLRPALWDLLKHCDGLGPFWAVSDSIVRQVISLWATLSSLLLITLSFGLRKSSGCLKFFSVLLRAQGFFFSLFNQRTWTKFLIQFSLLPYPHILFLVPYTFVCSCACQFSFQKYLLRNYYVPKFVSGTGDIVMKEVELLYLINIVQRL